MKHTLALPYYWLLLTAALTAINVAQNIATLSPFRWDADIETLEPLTAIGCAGPIIVGCVLLPRWFSLVQGAFQPLFLFVISGASVAMAVTSGLCLILLVLRGENCLLFFCSHTIPQTLLAIVVMRIANHTD
ncbi:MAG: hypothetical protein AB8G99_01065 [Planctomycetaceae bacterium]